MSWVVGKGVPASLHHRLSGLIPDAPVHAGKKIFTGVVSWVWLQLISSVYLYWLSASGSNIKIYPSLKVN